MGREHLSIKVTTAGAKKSERELDRLEKQGKRTERATDKMSKSFKGASIAVAALAAGAATLAAKSIAAYASIENLKNRLVTATGSLEGAAVKFDKLNKLATETPFAMDEVVTAFVKLKNLGLDPSERAILSYGNTASAMGKSLDQLIEAVADASVGEFERLKEFGIKAKSEGDNVSFTFQGITTTIKKNASEIEGYLQGIGEVQFAGSMERQADSMDTIFSNLNASVTLLAAKFADESGLAGAVKKASLALTDLFNTMAGIPRQTSIIADEIERLSEALTKAPNARSKKALRTQLKELREELTLSRSISTNAKDLKAGIAELDKQLTTYRDTLAGFDGAPTARIDTRRGSRANPARKRYEAATKGLIEAGEERIRLLARLAESEKQTREEGEGTSAPKGGANKALINLEASLRTEEEVISESYSKRLDIILKNTEEGSEKRADLKARLDKQYASDALGEFAVADTVGDELARLNESFEAKRTAILENTQITEEMRTELELELTAQRNQQVAQIEQQARSMQLSHAADFFGSIAQIALVAGGKQSKIFKAAAIANATIKTYEAATSAYSAMASIPYVGPALGAAAAAAAITAGLANVSAINNVSGAYDQGGFIPSGSVGIVGEFGPELVNGPANVTSREDTMDMIRGNKSSQNVVVNININAMDTDSAARVIHSQRGQIVSVIRSAFNEAGQEVAI